MSSFSDVFEVDVLKSLLGQTTTILDTSGGTITPYVGLYTSAPTDAGGGTEVTGGSYARVDTSSSIWGTPASGSVTNSAGAITFTTATASWGTVVAVGLFDASSGGNLLAWDTISSKAIDNGDTAEIASSAFTITLT